MPRGLPLHQQEARVIEAFGILENEQPLIRMHFSEAAERARR